MQTPKTNSKKSQKAKQPEHQQSVAHSDIAIILKPEVEKILDLVRNTNENDPQIRCLVKYKEIAKPGWMAVSELKQRYPILLINHYESLLELKRDEYCMKFAEKTTKSASRKLVVTE